MRAQAWYTALVLVVLTVSMLSCGAPASRPTPLGDPGATSTALTANAKTPPASDLSSPTLGESRSGSTVATPTATQSAIPSPSPVVFATTTARLGTPAPTVAAPAKPSDYLVSVRGYEKYDPFVTTLSASSHYRGGVLPPRALDPFVTVSFRDALFPDRDAGTRLVGLMESYPLDSGRLALGGIEAHVGWSSNARAYMIAFVWGKAVISVSTGTLSDDRAPVRRYATRLVPRSPNL